MTTTQAQEILEVAIPGVALCDGWRKADTVEIFVRGATRNDVVAITNLIFDAIAASGTCLPDSRSYPAEHEDNGFGNVVAGPAAAVRALFDDDLAFDADMTRRQVAYGAVLAAEEQAEATARMRALADESGREFAQLRAAQRAGAFGRAMQNRAWGAAAREAKA